MKKKETKGGKSKNGDYLTAANPRGPNNRSVRSASALVIKG